MHAKFNPVWGMVLLMSASLASAQPRGSTPETPGTTGAIESMAEAIDEGAQTEMLLDLVDRAEQRAARKLPPRDQWPPAPVARTGQTRSYAIGDDGYYQFGVPWPEPRFTDNHDGTVRDNLTGLIWLAQSSGGFGVRSWEEAINICNEMADGQAGLTDGSRPGDWRLPNLREIASLMDYSQDRPALPEGHPFRKVLLASHWASNTHPLKSHAGYRYATQNGSYGGYSSKSSGRDPVWPVRGGVCMKHHDANATANGQDDDQTAALLPVLQTGQTESYTPGDDGDHQCGLPLTLPDGPRFKDNDNGTITDRLTGLIWLTNARREAKPATWTQAIAFCNKLADGQAGLHDGSKPGDWRLPNVHEIASLIDYSQFEPALPAKHPFTYVNCDLYWTSTTSPGDPELAYSMNLMEGRLWVKNKLTEHSVWAVRGGF